MTILIDNRSGAPIYDQIYQQIRGAILGGELAADAALPSIRSLAKDLRISVITTKRAYEDLEREETLKQIESRLLEAAQLAAGAGVSRAELEEMLDILTEEMK